MLTQFFSILVLATFVQTPALLLETDPLPFALRGYSLHVSGAPDSSAHWTVGADLYGMRMPGFLANLGQEESGWDLRMRGAVGVTVEYVAATEPKGWFVAVHAAWSRFRLTLEESPGIEATYDALLIAPFVGYRWYPWDAGFYLAPRLGLGIATRVAGAPRVGAVEYSPSRFTPLPAVHLGYSIFD